MTGFEKRGIVAKFILIVSLLTQGLMTVLAVVVSYTASRSSPWKLQNLLAKSCRQPGA
ncbi:MAG: hypothetical protein WC256_00830 [Desulfurivibrionaceae bacterium]